MLPEVVRARRVAWRAAVVVGPSACARVDGHLEKKRVLGPRGHLGHGLWWALSKLFVIR